MYLLLLDGLNKKKDEGSGRGDIIVMACIHYILVKSSEGNQYFMRSFKLSERNPRKYY